MLNQSIPKHIQFLILGLTLGYFGKYITSLLKKRTKSIKVKEGSEDIREGIEGLIGNTPLILIKSLSDATGCRILAKAEFLNPGGSPKDRVGLYLINEAEKKGTLKPNCGYTIFEGTVGSTGISLAMLSKAKGYNCHIVMPDDMAEEKVSALRSLGATVERVRPASIVDPGHFVNIARQRAIEKNERDGKGFFVDQFENKNNFMVHKLTTGPEILRQTNYNLDAFVSGAGTGGTLAGVAICLKEALGEDNVKIILADPQGSGLYNKVKYDTLYSPVLAEGQRKRHQVDTLVEGIGLTRLTYNFETGLPYIDHATSVTDQQATYMARFVMENDGIFIGSSSAVNLVGAVRMAKELGPGHTVVTLLCDSGTRHNTKFWSQSFIENLGLDHSIPDNLDFVDIL